MGDRHPPEIEQRRDVASDPSLPCKVFSYGGGVLGAVVGIGAACA